MTTRPKIWRSEQQTVVTMSSVYGCYGFCLLLTVVPRRCTVRLWKGGDHLGKNACVSQFPSPSTYTLALVGWHMLLMTDIRILLMVVVHALANPPPLKPHECTQLHTTACTHTFRQTHVLYVSILPRAADEAWDWPKCALHSEQLYVACDFIYLAMWPSWEAKQTAFNMH